MAAPLYAEFIIDFPEFLEIDQAYIEVKLAEAAVLLEEEAFGEDLYNIAVGYKAAHLLTVSPYGLQNQLTSDDGDTTYNKVYKTEILPRIAHRGLLL